MLETTIRFMALEEVTALPVMELADEYPLLKDDQETDLIASVEANGIREALILFEGQLLDGRNRLSAAVKAELEEIPVREFVGTIEEAEDLIIDLNEKRRHLLPVQRAYIADKHRAIVAKRSKERMSLGAAETNAKRWDFESPMDTPSIPDIKKESGTTRAILAKKHNAGEHAIDTVQKIRRVSEETMQDPDSDGGEVMTPRAIRASAVLTKMQKGTITLTDAQKSVFGDPGQEISADDPLAKFRQQLNAADNKWHEAAVELIKGGRDEDIENVRIKHEHLSSKFNDLEEIELKVQHHFEPEVTPSSDEYRWAGEVRIRLTGIVRLIQEKKIDPSMINKIDFLEVIKVLREFFDEVEQGFSVES